MIHILIVGMSENRGGVESYIMNIYRKIDRNKIQFDFLVNSTYSRMAFEDEIKELGGRVYYELYPLKDILKDKRKSAYNFLKEHPEIDGVYVNTCSIWKVFRVFDAACRLKKKVRIVHSHNTNYLKKIGFFDKIYEFIERIKINRYATNLYACSEEAGTWMFHTKRFNVITNGIDTKDYIYDENKRNTIRKLHGIKKNELVVGTVGRIQEQKNPFFIIELIKKMKECGLEFKFIYIGDGDLKEAILEKINEYNLNEYVIMLGMINSVNEYLNSIDIFIMPSKFEGMPFAVIEAQCNGAKCLVSNKISEKCKLIDSLEFLNINSVDEWVERIVKSDRKRMFNAEIEIKRKGFDINEIVNFFENEIISLVKKGE